MIKKALLFIYLVPIICFSQILNTISYRNTDNPYTELDPAFYNFLYPINSDILDSNNPSNSSEGLYLKADFGHRYLTNVIAKTDNHGGFDYWSNHSYGGIEYNDDIKTPIICMCDGIITKVIDGPDIDLELTPEGRSVQITCTKKSQSFDSAIKINYNHLSTLASLPAMAFESASNTISINKGDTIGLMGKSGTTTNVHLHLSTQINHPSKGTFFVNPARIFNPNDYPNVLKPLTNATIELLYRWDTNVLFRIIWPHNETINEFEFINDSYNVKFNKEEAYNVGTATRDDHNAIPGIQVYAYPFNGKQTVLDRYDGEKANMPAIYPASPQRDINLSSYIYPHLPITNDDIAQVYDFVIQNVPSSLENSNFIVKLSDVWGYTVEGSFTSKGNADDLSDFQTSLYPNPTEDKITITTNPKNAILEIDLFNSIGKHLTTIHTINHEEVIDLEYLPANLYYLKIKSSKGIQTFKVLKK